MQRHTRNLFIALVSAAALTLLGIAPSRALDLPPPLHYNMGPLGDWTVSGGLEADLAGWNNAPHSCNGNDNPGDRGCNGGAGGPPVGGAILGGGNQTQGDIDLTNAIFIINSHGNMFGNFPLQFHAWIGEPPQTAVMGYTSPLVGPNLYASNGFHSLDNTGAASFCFKCWATFQPFDWFSIEGGRLPSVDGTEIGVGFLNNLPFLSGLNNMQTTVADGVQVNFIMPGDNAFYWGFVPGYGSALTVRIADGYKTGHMNELGFLGLWNLTPDASDFIAAYGHTRLSTVGSVAGLASTTTNPYPVGGFGMWNSNLIGVGTVFNLTNRLSMNAEIETQWLPKSDISAANRVTTGNQDYYRWSTQWTFAYDFGLKQIFGQPIRVGAAIQPSYTYMHGDTSDPNGNQFGNFYGLDVSDSASGTPDAGDLGTFGQGSKYYGLQLGPSFQFHNAYVRPTLAWNHLASIDNGFGYGATGTDHDQVVLMLDFGFLLGKYEDSDTGQ